MDKIISLENLIRKKYVEVRKNLYILRGIVIGN
jgi:hypothetical protein